MHLEEIGGLALRNGKAFTSFGDNDDVAIFEQAQEVLDAAGYDKQMRWVTPEEDLTVTLDVFGQILGLAHGHQAHGGGGPQGKTLAWRRRMADMRHPIGDADILVTGHYHHLHIHADGPKTWLLCPSLEGGSEWFAAGGGPPSVGQRHAVRPGTLSFTIDRAGWSDLEVLR